MFGIGWSEYLLIGVIALIAIGPKELPGVMRTAGQWMAKIRRMSAEFQSQVQEALREAELADLKKTVDDTMRTISKPIDPAEFIDQFEPAKAETESKTETKTETKTEVEPQAAEAKPDAPTDMTSVANALDAPEAGAKP